MSQTVQAYSSRTHKERESRINPRIFLLAFGMLALGTSAFVVASVLPDIARETGVTEGQAGQVVTAFSLTYGLGAPVLAALTARWSRNMTLLGSLIFFCLANVGTAIAPTFPLLLLARVLGGCFAAAFAPLAYAAGISLAPPEKRGQALALVNIGLSVAVAIGSPLGILVGEHFGWRMTFVLIAGLAGAASLALLLIRLPKATAQPTLSFQASIAPITQPSLLLALLPAVVWNLGVYTVYTYIAPFLHQNMHIVDISGQLVAYGLGVVVASLLGGRIADRFGSTRPLVIMLVALTIIQALLTFTTTTFLGGLLALFVWGLSSTILFIPQQVHLLSVAPEHDTMILALNTSTLYLGIAGGATLGGLALHAVSVPQLPWIGAICVLLALLPFVFSVHLSRRHMKTHERGKREKEEMA